MLFHLFLTREYDGADVTTYVDAFQSETSALVRASRLVAEYVGSSVLIQEEDESENVVYERVISCQESYAKLPETLQSLGLEPGGVAYVERVDRRRLIVHTTDGRVLRAYDVDRDVTA